MAIRNEKEPEKCWACKSVLVEDGKLGLCPKCVNKYGTPTAAAAALGIVFVVRQAWKNGGKIVKLAANIVKHI